MAEKPDNEKNREKNRTGDGPGEASAQPPRAEGGEEAAANAASEQIAKLQAEKDELTQTLVRRQADYENYRKRIERERHEEHRRGAARIIEDLLPVLDAVDRALKTYSGRQYEDYRKGLELIHRQMQDLLSRHGVERIAAEGKIFDPNFHQAIERVETNEHPEDTVVEVVQDGYLYHGRVLRPSVVRVASHTEEHSTAGR